FAGLSGTAKTKAVVARAGLSGLWLRDLVRDDDVDLERVRVLLQAMQEAARPVRSAALGVLGEPHMAAFLVRHFGADGDSIRYKKAVLGEEDEALPFALEVAFGAKDSQHDDEPRDLVGGLNWSPALSPPFDDLPRLLGGMRVDDHDPV